MQASPDRAHGARVGPGPRYNVRGTSYPRRIAVRVATVASNKVIGRCLSHARPMETFDLVRVPHFERRPSPSPAPVLSLYNPNQLIRGC